MWQPTPGGGGTMIKPHWCTIDEWRQTASFTHSLPKLPANRHIVKDNYFRKTSLLHQKLLLSSPVADIKSYCEVLELEDSSSEISTNSAASWVAVFEKLMCLLVFWGGASVSHRWVYFLRIWCGPQFFYFLPKISNEQTFWVKELVRSFASYCCV